MQILKQAAVTVVAALLLLPVTAVAKPPSGKHVPRVVVYPNYPTQPRNGPYGFLPGYRAPLPLGEWRDRAPRYGGGDFSRNRRFWSGGEWRYGWGGPGFYRGRWNGGSFGPCWTQTPIGPMWNCGM
jgi:hypothetical protein